jgi:tetratricopeptide (TPR) repeat protein
VLAALVLLALAGCATAPTSSRVEDTRQMRTLQARSAYERGTVALNEQQIGAAVGAFQEAAQLDPTVAVYADAMGTVLLQMRQVEGALAWLNRAVELDPTYGDAQLHRATALFMAGRVDDAVDGYRRALSLPTLTVPHVAHQNLGYALYALKRYREAEQSLRYALTLEAQEPQMAATYVNLGLVLVADGRKEEAKAAFRQARRLAPESVSARDAAEQLKALGDGS